MRRRASDDGTHLGDATRRVRARAGEESTAQSTGGEDVSGRSGAVSGGQASGASSSNVVTTRSASARSVIARQQRAGNKRGRKAGCGLDVCGSSRGWTTLEDGTCADCGCEHPENASLCAACHKTPEDRVWKHLAGEDMRSEAIAWVERCREEGRGLPAGVVESFVPSGACLCNEAGCFYRGFDRERSRKKFCVPCGTTKSVRWRTGQVLADQYQFFFKSTHGVGRTTNGMAKTQTAITADSDICNACHMTYYNHQERRMDLPTAEELSISRAAPNLVNR